MSRKNKNAIRKSAEDHIVNTICTVLACLLALACIYPLYYALINSFNDGHDALKGGIYLWPRMWTLNNYQVVFRDDGLLLSFLLTVLRTVVGTLLTLLCTTIASYALSRKELVFRRFYIYAGLTTMFVGSGIIPTYMLYRQLKLLNTFWVYVLPSMFSFGNAIYMINYFRKQPEALVESARIDGAQEFTILLRIIIPISKPILATIALFVGVMHWNDWYAPAYYVTSEKLMTMPATLMRLLSQKDAMAKMKEFSNANVNGLTTTLDTIRYATLIVTVVPITILYPFLQKYFIQGMMLGALKE